MLQLESSINFTRRLMAQLSVVIKCKLSGKYMKHQNALHEMFRKKYVNTRLATFEYQLTMLKQKLASTSQKLKLTDGSMIEK